MITVPKDGSKNVKKALETLTAQDFLSFGVDQIVYLKPDDESEGWALHAADGTPLSVFATVEEAVVATKEYDVRPVRLH